MEGGGGLVADSAFGVHRVAAVLALCGPLCVVVCPYGACPTAVCRAALFPVGWLRALPSLVLFSLRLVHLLPLVCAVGGGVCGSLPPVVAGGLSFG